MNQDKLAAQTWSGGVPDVRDQRFPVPRSIADAIAGLDGAWFQEARLEGGVEPPCEELAREIRAWASPYLARLLAAPGMVIFQLPPELPDEQLRAGYYLLSRSLGRLDRRYGYLFDVKDRGLDYTKEAVPVSKTRASTGYHTDSTARDYLPDLVGLLCLNAGHRGGESLVVNAADLYRHMIAVAPRLVDVLSQPLYRDVITPGSVNNVEAILANRFPVFSLADGRLTCRYMRFWIETAYQKIGQRMPDGLLEALDFVDAYMNAPGNSLMFQLGRGDALYINNRFLCHGRTDFEDDPANHEVRLLVRTWLHPEA
jgi:hypothetical protein